MVSAASKYPVPLKISLWWLMNVSCHPVESDGSGSQIDTPPGTSPYLVPKPTIWYPTFWYPLYYLVSHLPSDILHTIWYPIPYLVPHLLSDRVYPIQVWYPIPDKVIPLESHQFPAPVSFHLLSPNLAPASILSDSTVSHPLLSGFSLLMWSMLPSDQTLPDPNLVPTPICTPL